MLIVGISGIVVDASYCDINDATFPLAGGVSEPDSRTINLARVECRRRILPCLPTLP